MKLKGKKIGILFESDFYENEIFYYKFRFPEEGADLHFLTRLWGQNHITFLGHEYKIPVDCNESFEKITDEELETYSAIIIPSGMVSDRLRYTEDSNKIPPAAEFMRRAFNKKNILKGIICHGMWLMAPVIDVIKGRRVVVHNNLISDAKNYGLQYINEDVVVDKDLITGRSGGHCHMFAKKIIEILSNE
ncbi:DJ-1/PfpI family protein [Candidatus Desantisbacteria bacterium]|nr:DJ-1/PfpI family protein [Candidatus Desantisbacteria bacterium]